MATVDKTHRAPAASVGWHQSYLDVATTGRGCVDITSAVDRVVADANFDFGICHVFLQHTSASLMLCENADPDVLHDLETWLARAVQDADPAFRHTAEGPDDMSAHIRGILTGVDLNIPVTAGGMALGTWQGIYLYEHRARPHNRQLVVTVQGVI